MEPKVERFPWPKDLENNPKNILEGIPREKKNHADKIRDNTDRLTGLMGYSASSLEEVIDEMKK